VLNPLANPRSHPSPAQNPSTSAKTENLHERPFPEPFEDRTSNPLPEVTSDYFRLPAITKKAFFSDADRFSQNLTVSLPKFNLGKEMMPFSTGSTPAWAAAPG
jgi:hypothetical protein